MEDLRALVSKVKFPVELPEAAFLNVGGQVCLADMTAIIDVLPAEIKSFIDMELTITNISANTFALPLKDGRYLFVKIKGKTIISLDIVSRH